MSNLLLTTVISMMAQNLNASMSKKHHLMPLSSPVCLSSPLLPPLTEPHLLAFLKTSGHAKRLSAEVIASAFENLNHAQYTLDILHEANVSTDHLQELTGLAEGDVYSLKKFACE